MNAFACIIGSFAMVAPSVAFSGVAFFAPVGEFYGDEYGFQSAASETNQCVAARAFQERTSDETVAFFFGKEGFISFEMNSAMAAWFYGNDEFKKPNEEVEMTLVDCSEKVAKRSSSNQAHDFSLQIDRLGEQAGANPDGEIRPQQLFEVVRAEYERLDSEMLQTAGEPLNEMFACACAAIGTSEFSDALKAIGQGQ